MNPVDPEELTTRYEETRSFALGEVVSFPVGFSLIVRSGVAAWIRALSACMALPSKEPMRRGGSGMPFKGRQGSDVAVILANMVCMNLKGGAYP